MQISSTLTTLVAALSLAAGANAWAQAADGTWVANDVMYYFNNIHVAECCTYKDTQIIHEHGDGCAFWADGEGKIVRGGCTWYDDYFVCGADIRDGQ